MKTTNLNWKSKETLKSVVLALSSEPMSLTKLMKEVAPLVDKENTIPTENKKIMIAKVRRYEYADILDIYAEFEKLSRTVKIMDTVRLMKKVVPEFKSKNSPRFEVLDKELE